MIFMFVFLTFHTNFYSVCDVDFDDAIEITVSEYEALGGILICGDINCRTGLLSDTLKNDNLNRYIICFKLNDVPMIPERRSNNRTVNAYGLKLSQLCYNTCLIIANGRLGDNASDDFTFCTAKRSECSRLFVD